MLALLANAAPFFARYWKPVVLVLLLAGAYLVGRNDGRDIMRGHYAAAERAAEKVRATKQAEIDRISARLESEEAQRSTVIREITREVPKIVDRPVYSRDCLDADGVRLINRAVEAGNNPAEPDRSLP